MSLAIALGMGVGTIGALVVEGPSVTRYVVVDLRPLEPAPSTAPEPFPGLPLRPNIPPRRDPGVPGARTGPGPAPEPLDGGGRATGAVPPPATTRARVSTGRGAASVREAWLRARRRKGKDPERGKNADGRRSPRHVRPGSGVPGSPA